MATNPHRFGNATAGYVDLPFVQGGTEATYLIPGSQRRSVNGTLLSTWTGTPKLRFTFDFKPWASDSVWRTFQRIVLSGPGPFELYDPVGSPNLLSIDDRLGIGWVTSTGTAVTATTSTRLVLSASPAQAQTAITASPAAANLTPVAASTQHTAAITVDTASSFTGTWGVYGYTATPSGSGTLQGSTTALTVPGRYLSTFTTGGTIVYVELRAVRTAGSATIADAGLYPGAVDPGRGIRNVMLTPESLRLVTGYTGGLGGESNRTTVSVAFEEV